MTSKHPHSRLIDLLGGTVTVARTAGRRASRDLRSQTVSAWRRRGIAFEWRPTIKALLEASDLAAPADFLDPPSRQPEGAPETEPALA